MEETKQPLLFSVLKESCDQEFTAEEQAFLKLASEPDMPEKIIYFNVSAPTVNFLKEADGFPWPRLPEEVRPLIWLFEVINQLAWLEVALTIICAFVSIVFGQVHLAQLCLLAGFAVAFQKKLQAVRTMTSGDKLCFGIKKKKINFGKVVSTFLDVNYSIGGVQLPVRRLWVSMMTSFPSFAEGALTAIALPHAYQSSPLLGGALGFLLAWSSMIQIIGTRRCLLKAKYHLISLNLYASGKYNAYSFYSNVWHWVTMAAAASNLTLIAACGDQITNMTKEKEPNLVYKIQCHDENSVAPRVVNRFIMTAGPRMAVKILLLGRMGTSPVADRLNMFLAIVSGSFSIIMLFRKLTLSVWHKWRLMRGLLVGPIDEFTGDDRVAQWTPDNTISIPKVFLNPFALQFITFHARPREMVFDESLYVALALLVYMFWAGGQLLLPVQQLVQDCFLKANI